MTESNKLTGKVPATHAAEDEQQIKKEEEKNGNSLLKLYYTDKIIDKNEQINQLELELRILKQELQNKIYYVKSATAMLHRMNDTSRCVATVLSVLGNDLVKIKIGSDKYVIPCKPGLKLQVNNIVGVDFTETGEMQVYRQLEIVHDPLLSLMLVQRSNDEASYEMIGGLQKQIREIREVVELPLLHPELFEAVGIDQPKGVLLYGPPGTGKTLLARAVAYHTKCAFFKLSGTELVQKYIGEGARLLRELFVMARKRAPAIIFLDEIDSIGSSSRDSCEHAMNELLTQVDGFEPSNNIKIVLATNRIDTLDSALLRPGRVDRKIFFPAPNLKERVDILKVHSHQMRIGKCVNFNKIAELTPGASGAELKLLCQEAAFCALREGRIFVKHDNFEQKISKVLDRVGKNTAFDPSVK